MHCVTSGVLMGLIALSAPTRALGCDAQTGERVQWAFLDWNGQNIDIWEVVSAEPKRFVLPNGFELGLSIEPAAPDKYAADWREGRHVPELVKVTLFDSAAVPPTRLTFNWAGANSFQGYGSDGGADRLEQLGSPGITLKLLKPVCAQPETTPTGTASDSR
jgi:hypothetical protein